MEFGLDKALADELISLLVAMVRIPSVNPPGLESEMTALIERVFGGAGISTIRVPTGRAGRENVVATLPGRRHDIALVFTGHQDVVPVRDAERMRWRFDPFGAQIEGGRLYGRGSADMKSGLAAAMMAMVAMARSGEVPPCDILLAATCDEEDGMTGSKALIETDLFECARHVVVCEPTSMEVCRAGKGRTYGTVVVRGGTAHGSQKGVGQNAIELAAELMAAIRAEDFSAWTDAFGGESFWRVLAISAGVEPQVVPDVCTMTLDARLSTRHAPEEIWQRLAALAAKVMEEHPPCSITWEVADLRAPFVTPAEDALVEILQKAMRRCAVLYRESLFAGTTDGTQFAKIGLKPVIFGPGDLSCVHRENEYVALADVITATILYREIIRSYDGKDI